MIKLNNFLLIISFVVMVLAFFKRDTFSSDMTILPALNHEPIQLSTSTPPFSTTYNEVTFQITPKFQYELYGLVVSYRLHDASAGQMLHALNKDHLNVADFCVVWGQSADPKLLHEFNFSNGQFSCQFGTKNLTAWEKFEPNQLSNNHLLATDKLIRNTIDEIKIGDQIHIKGWLSHYQNTTGYERGTSITRTDKGNGACETIFVEDIKILSNMSGLWRKLLWLSFGLFLLTLFIYFRSPYRPH